MKAARDATDLKNPKLPKKKPVDEFALRFEGNRETKRPPIPK